MMMTTTESDTKYCKKAVQVRKLSESDVDGQRIVFKFGRLLCYGSSSEATEL